MLANILIVEDHPDIVEILRYNLEKEGFKTTVAVDGEEALKLVKTQRPDLVLLDLMLPKLSGLDVCQKLRKDPSTKMLPVIMITAKGEEGDIVRGLELGADDYVTKPFGPQQVVARVRAVLRRARPSMGILRIKDLVIDSDRHAVTIKGKDVSLTRSEFRLLRTLAAQPGRVFTRDQLIDSISGGDDVSIVDRNIDVHISSVRKKLEDYGERIVTVRGVGYRFSE